MKPTILEFNSTSFIPGDAFMKEILSFATLKKGWDDGLGKAISIKVILKALNIYSNFKNPLFDYECTPLSNDSIILTFCLKDHFLDIHICKTKMDLVYEYGIGKEFDTIKEIDNARFKDLSYLLSHIEQQCFSSGLLTSQNIVQESKDSTTVLEKWEAVSQFLTMTVPSNQVVTYANI